MSTAYSRAVNEVLAERERQVGEEGYTSEHDAEHVNDELVEAAIAYLDPDHSVGHWPWVRLNLSDEGERNTRGDRVTLAGFKPTERRRNLVKAAALILAELERIDHE